MDGSIPEILVDDSDIDKAGGSGGWKKDQGAHYKSSFVRCANTKPNTDYTFQPVVKQRHHYEVYFYCTALPDAALGL